jgi:hypothetical protein
LTLNAMKARVPSMRPTLVSGSGFSGMRVAARAGYSLTPATTMDFAE